MAATDKPPAKIREVAERVGVEEVREPVTNEQIDNIGRLQDIRERVKHHRTIVTAWKHQQEQDREMRKLYATWLMAAMSIQIVAINIIFILIGCKVLTFEPWTANTFVVAVFAEVGALVLLVVKYLFPAASDKILELIGVFKSNDPIG